MDEARGNSPANESWKASGFRPRGEDKKGACDNGDETGTNARQRRRREKKKKNNRFPEISAGACSGIFSGKGANENYCY